MQETRPCGLSANESCGAPEPLALADAQQRFEREAVHGRCDTTHYRCSYYTWGTGPPLLFIPGMADDALSFVPVASLLSRQFRCIAYDLPTGRGDGARLGQYRHEDLVADVFELLDHVGVRQSYVFGASFGSTIALAALRAAPSRLPRAVLQGGFARRPLAPAELLLATLGRYLPGSMRWLPLRRALLRHQHHPPFAARGSDYWEFFLQRLARPPITAVAHRALMLHRIDLCATLPEVRQPVLIVCGDCDPLVNKQCERELMEGLPNVVRVELERCGHLPLFTHPELLAEIVRRFLTPPASQAAGCSADPA